MDLNSVLGATQLSGDTATYECVRKGNLGPGWDTYQILYCGRAPGSEPEGPPASAQLGAGTRAATR